MSDGSGLEGVIVDEVRDQIDVADLLGEGSVQDSIDGSELGAAVGRRFGEQMGRELGAAIGREVHQTVAADVDEEVSVDEMRGDITTAIRDAVTESARDVAVADSTRSLLDQVTGESAVEGLLEGGDEEEAEADEDEAAEDDEADEEADEATGEDAVGDAESADAEAEDGTDSDGPSASDLESLRSETLSDFLGVMSYEDLQSVAKDVGVKANLSREEMTDRIVEQVTESSESDEEAQAKTG